MNKTYEEVRHELKSKLTAFLNFNKIEKKGEGKNTKYVCFHPEHKDTHPSMSIDTMPDGSQVYYCHGCHEGGDIFTANNIINGKPLIGFEFITENLKPLCDHFEIEYEPRPMTDEEIEKMNIRSALQHIKNIIELNLLKATDNIDPQVKKYIQEKRLDRIEYIPAYGLGIVPNWDDFIYSLKSIGIDDKLIEKIGIEKYLFNSGNLIFTICDEYGNPIAFAARNCYFNSDDKTSSKYYNNKETIFYNKSAILYNIHRALRKPVYKHNSLYIVEGYPDATALDISGYKVGALGGTALTGEHIGLFQRLGITDIVLLFDGDDAGRKSAGKAVKLMEGIRNFRTRIVLLPEGEDPDTFIAKFGTDALLELPHKSTFEWRIEELKQKTDLDGHEIANQILPLIVNERSLIQRDKMCIQLSQLSDVPVEAIRRELQLISNNREIRAKEERDAIIDNHMKMLKRSPDDALIILRDTAKAVQQVSESNHSSLFDETEVLEGLIHLKYRQEQPDFSGRMNLWRMPRLAEFINGNLIGKLMLLNGQPNAGKTSFIANFIINLLFAGMPDKKYGILEDMELANNITIVMHTVDDARSDFIPRLVTSIAYETFKFVTINTIDAPYEYHGPDHDLFMKVREDAYQLIMKWVKTGQLIIKDATHGKNVSSAAIMIDATRTKFPGRKVLYICDNMYNLSDFMNISDETTRTAYLCNVLNDLAVQEDITVLATAEYRKGSGDVKGYQALNEQMRGSKGMEYRANWIGHLLNDLHTQPEDTDMFFSTKTYPDGVPQDRKLPVITLRVSKNKINSKKGDVHFFFNPEKALYLEAHRNNLDLLQPTARVRLEKIYDYQRNNTVVANIEESASYKLTG